MINVESVLISKISTINYYLFYRYLSSVDVNRKKKIRTKDKKKAKVTNENSK